MGLRSAQVEKLKQDDSLTELSSVLDELKDMAIDMGSEIDRFVLLCLNSVSSLNVILNAFCFCLHPVVKML